MRRAFALLPFVALLAAAPAAEAKFSVARVCGRSDCAAVTFADGNQLAAVEEAYFGGVDATGAQIGRRVTRPAPHPPAAAPWFRVTLCPRRCPSRYARTLRVLPTTGYEYLGRTGWVILGKRPVAAYRRITRGLRPFPTARLRSIGARAGGSAASDVGSHGRSSQGGVPGWAGIALAGPATAIALLSRRWWRRRRPRQGPEPSADAQGSGGSRS